MNILIAPNAFKNSLNAAAAAGAIREGLLQSKLNCTCTCFPVADGGDGTAELIIQQCGGEIITVEVYDPLGRKIQASFGLIEDGNTAVIEMADASGLRLLNIDELNPLHASTYGTGELIVAALNKGVSKIIMGIGGSATVDGAVGMLQALGIRFTDAHGNDLKGMPESLVDLDVVDLSGLDKRILNCELVILCDVENTLLGANGAASVFGPQKGAVGDNIQKLERSLAKFRDVTFSQTGLDMAVIKHGGAAGGTAAGLAAFVNANLVNGIDHFLYITGFEEALGNANLVITGEGSIDAQTLHGKGPFGVAQKAKEKKIPVIGLAGKVPVETNVQLQQYFDVLLSVNHEPGDLAMLMKHTAANLVRTAKAIGDLLAFK